MLLLAKEERVGINWLVQVTSEDNLNLSGGCNIVWREIRQPSPFRKTVMCNIIRVFVNAGTAGLLILSWSVFSFLFLVIFLCTFGIVAHSFNYIVVLFSAPNFTEEAQLSGT